MIETFLLIGYQNITDGLVLDWQTNVDLQEKEIARREFEEFPSEEEIKEFMSEFHPTRCEIHKCYR